MEERRDDPGMGARDDDLGALGRHLHFGDIDTGAVALPIIFPGNLLPVRKESLCATQVDNEIAPLEAAHDPVDQLPDAILELVEDPFALSFANLLDDYLFGGLSGDPAEVTGFHLHAERITDFDLGVDLPSFLQIDLLVGVLNLVDHGDELEDLYLAKLVIVVRLEIAGIAVLLVGRGKHRRLKGFNQDGTIDTLVLDDLVDDMVEIYYHPITPFCHLSGGRSFASLQYFHFVILYVATRHDQHLELRVEMCLFYSFECELDDATPFVALAQPYQARLQAEEFAEEGLAHMSTVVGIDLVMHLDLYTLSDEPMEILRLFEGAVKPRRGNLQTICRGDHVFDLKRYIDFSAEIRAVVQSDPTLLVDEEA